MSNESIAQELPSELQPSYEGQTPQTPELQASNDTPESQYNTVSSSTEVDSAREDALSTFPAEVVSTPEIIKHPALTVLELGRDVYDARSSEVAA